MNKVPGWVWVLIGGLMAIVLASGSPGDGKSACDRAIEKYKEVDAAYWRALGSGKLAPGQESEFLLRRNNMRAACNGQ